ncbi:MAG: hypothetical protein IPK39_00905 [Sulfuritalea sp.]|nr:hypothetical protein [Sulfuritalea sp.]
MVLASSRRLFIQYSRASGGGRQFLLEAVRFMDGACGRCVIDNSSVILAGGASAYVIAPGGGVCRLPQGSRSGPPRRRPRSQGADREEFRVR